MCFVIGYFYDEIIVCDIFYVLWVTTKQVYMLCYVIRFNFITELVRNNIPTVKTCFSFNFSNNLMQRLRSIFRFFKDIIKNKKKFKLNFALL